MFAEEGIFNCSLECFLLQSCLTVIELLLGGHGAQNPPSEGYIDRLQYCYPTYTVGKKAKLLQNINLQQTRE